MPTKTELLCKAKELGLKGYTGMDKNKLEQFVEANTPKTYKAKRPKKTTPPAPAPAPVKKLKVRKPKTVNPMSIIDDANKYLQELEQKKIAKTSPKGIDTSAIDEAKKFLEDLGKKQTIKGVAKLKGTIAKGKAENLLRKAMAKYKASKTEKAEKAKGKAEGLLRKAMLKFKYKKVSSQLRTKFKNDLDSYTEILNEEKSDYYFTDPRLAHYIKYFKDFENALKEGYKIVKDGDEDAVLEGIKNFNKAAEIFDYELDRVDDDDEPEAKPEVKPEVKPKVNPTRTVDKTKPYFFPEDSSGAKGIQLETVIFEGMLKIIDNLLKIKTVTTGRYFDVAFHRPVPDSELYFDLVIKTDAEEIKQGKEYKTLLPPAGEEYGGKVDIQMYPEGWKIEGKNQNYLRLQLVDEDDQKRTGFPWSSHYRGEYGRSDSFDEDYDEYLENVMKELFPRLYTSFYKSLDERWSKMNAPLWNVLKKRFSKYYQPKYLR